MPPRLGRRISSGARSPTESTCSAAQSTSSFRTLVPASAPGLPKRQCPHSLHGRADAQASRLMLHQPHRRLAPQQDAPVEPLVYLVACAWFSASCIRLKTRRPDALCGDPRRQQIRVSAAALAGQPGRSAPSRIAFCRPTYSGSRSDGWRNGASYPAWFGPSRQLRSHHGRGFTTARRPARFFARRYAAYSSARTSHSTRASYSSSTAAPGRPGPPPAAEGSRR